MRCNMCINKPLAATVQVIAGWVMMLPVSMCVAASDFPDAADIKRITTEWQCRWCPDIQAESKDSEVQVGLGAVSNDSYKHGDYRGLHEQGVFADISGRYAREYASGRYEYLSINDAGLESRSAAARAGMQGVADLSVQYSQLPMLNSDTARSPYSGDVVKELPSGWVAGNDTQNMSELETALHATDIGVQRRSVTLNAEYYQSQALSFDMRFQRDTKQGDRSIGLALGRLFTTARAIIVDVPVDYITNSVDMNINYQGRRWQARLGYQLSDFTNGHSSVGWDNAFSQPNDVSGGQAALEPNNSMHQLSIAGAYRFSSSLQSNVSLAIGRMYQNEAFLPYTVNTNLSPFTLPRESLDGEINTYNGSFLLHWQVAPLWQMKLRFQQHEQDNDTPRATYDYIIADTLPSAAGRANFPYSFRMRDVLLEAKYQLNPADTLRFGVELNRHDRTYQEVATTEEHDLFAVYKGKFSEQFNLSLRARQQRRSGDNYSAVTEITPAENPLLRKYNLADRDRDTIGLDITIAALDDLQFSVLADYADDDYTHSALGLQSSSQSVIALNADYEFSPSLGLNVLLSVSQIDSVQAGSQNFSTQTWAANSGEQINTVQIGVNYRLWHDRLKLNLSYAYEDANADMAVTGSAALPAFKTRRQTFIVRGDYRLDDQSELAVYYSYEKYEEDNWAIDSVVPNTIPNVLTMGDVAPSYDIGVIVVGYKRRF